MSSILRTSPQVSRILLLTLLVISLAPSALPSHSVNIAERSSNPLRVDGTPLSLAPAASAAPYDEQVGVTFTQNFSTLAFNVTAVAFTDNGIGPGYLVNGLTDRNYWYQVGLSYQWPLTNGAVNPGFSMNYEVFSPNQVSIYPANGGGGIEAFDGSVFSGDSILLSLRFSQGLVKMQAFDWQTGSVASQNFTAYANSNTFVGLSSRLAQSGFFSGLMTEQYHYFPYYGAGLPVTYSTSTGKISSAWMWMDEWNTNTFEPVFETNTTSPVSLSESFGQYFSSNGTSEIASAQRFVTGLTPVTFPGMFPGNQGAGRPGHVASIYIALEDSQGATVKFDNLTVLTSFGKYNFTLGTPFSFASSSGQYTLTMIIPSNLVLGTYNLTISVVSWSYLDTQAQLWIPLQPGSLNETLLVTNNPPPSNPPNNPGPSPPSNGQGPSRSTNDTAFSPGALLTALRSTVIPIIGSYAGLGLLAVALILRQERRRSRLYPVLGLRFCANCGKEITQETVIICPHCNFSATSATTASQSLPPGPETLQSVG